MSGDPKFLNTERVGEEIVEPILNNDPPDGAYGWVVVISAFFVHVFVLGNVYSFGLFYPIYIDVFKDSPANIAWIGSIGFCMLAGFGGLAGKWADEFGNGLIVFIGGLFISSGYFISSYSTSLWQLYLTHGFLVGCGYSLSFIAGVGVIGQWFSTRRGLATGLAVSGSGLGQFVMSITTQNLVENCGWRITLRYLALISLVGLSICGWFIRRRIPCTKKISSESSFVMFKDRNFNLLYAGAFFSSLGLVMPFTHLPLYAIKNGVSGSNAVWLLSCMGIASAVGRISMGFFADKYGKMRMLVLCVFGGGVSTLCWMACVTFPTLIVFSAVFGLFAGGLISLMPAVTAELFGIQRQSSVIGLLYTSTSVGNLLSAPIGGYLYAVYGNYILPISVAGAFMMFSLIFLTLIGNPSSSPSATDNSAAMAIDSTIEGGNHYSICTSLELQQLASIDDADNEATLVLKAEAVDNPLDL